MATSFLPGVIVLPARDDRGVAKRARDGDLLALSEEADARGWSSAVPERSLALRRRREPASRASPRNGGWVVAARAEERDFRREEEATPDAVGADVAAEKSVLVVPSCIAYSCNVDLAAFDPPPMAIPPLPLSAFVTDMMRDRVAKRPRDGDLLDMSEESDARGWSSAVPERSLALRRRRGPAASFSRGGCGWVVTAGDTTDELAGRPEESATADACRSGPVTADETDGWSFYSCFTR